MRVFTSLVAVAVAVAAVHGAQIVRRPVLLTSRLTSPRACAPSSGGDTLAREAGAQAARSAAASAQQAKPRSERGQAPSADGERTVYVLDNGAPKPVKVHTGVSDGKSTEIVSGELREGDPVILSVKAAQP